jgi:hypothetical protein
MWTSPSNRKPISCVNFAITRKCNMACPDCVCNVPHDKSTWEADWDYMVEAAKHFRGIGRLQLTGGEPSFHPHFVEWVPKLKELFQCKCLSIETNGYGLMRYLDVFRHFDWVLMTQYSDKSWLGCPVDNAEDIQRFYDHYRGRGMHLDHIDVRHVSRSTPSRGEKLCARGLSETVAYCQGLLYPCCIGWGVQGGRGIPLTANWREDILAVQPPCRYCWYGEA